MRFWLFCFDERNGISVIGSRPNVSAKFDASDYLFTITSVQTPMLQP